MIFDTEELHSSNFGEWNYRSNKMCNINPHKYTWLVLKIMVAFASMFTSLCDFLSPILPAYYIVVFIALYFTSVVKSYPTYYFRYCKDPVSPWGSIKFHIASSHLIVNTCRLLQHLTVIYWHVCTHTYSRCTRTGCLQAQRDVFVGFVLAHQQEICYCTSKPFSTIVWCSFSETQRKKEDLRGMCKAWVRLIVEQFLWKKRIIL